MVRISATCSSGRLVLRLSQCPCKILERGPQMTSITPGNDRNSAPKSGSRNDMSTQSAYHSKSGPAIGLADPATERDKLIAANNAFAVALNQARRSGKETPAGVLATVRPKRGKNGTLAL